MDGSSLSRIFQNNTKWKNQPKIYKISKLKRHQSWDFIKKIIQQSMPNNYVNVNLEWRLILTHQEVRWCSKLLS